MSMTCRECTEFLMAYLDGELPDEQRRIFDEHLGHCPPCVEFLKSYQETVKLGRSVCGCPEHEAAGQLPEPLVRAVLAALGKRPG